MSILNVKMDNKKLNVNIDGPLNDKQEQALAILLGGYNAHGRDVPLEEFAAIRNQVKGLIDELAAKL